MSERWHRLLHGHRFMWVRGYFYADGKHACFRCHAPKHLADHIENMRRHIRRQAPE